MKNFYGILTSISKKTHNPLMFYDSFTGDNGTNLTSHTPEIGNTWTEDFGNFKIQSNRARVESLTGTPARAVIVNEASISDFSLSCIINRSPTTVHAGVIFRYQDSTNFWLLDAISTGLLLIKISGGSGAVIGSSSVTLSNSVDYVLEITANGNSIICKVDDDNEISVTDADFESATKIGFYAEGGIQTLFDELQVLEL